MPILATPAPAPDPTAAALAADLRKQLLLRSVSKARKKLYTDWLLTHGG